jgi:hypothetical protein
MPEIFIQSFFQQILGIFHLIDDGFPVISKLFLGGAIVYLHCNELLWQDNNRAISYYLLRIHVRK